MAIQKLIEHLDKESTCYKELIGVLQKETEELIHRDYKGLYESAAKKEHLLTRLDSMARTRAALLVEAAESLGCTPPVKISAVVERLEGPDNKKLAGLQSTILALIETVKEINKVNSLVVKDSLENINKTLGLLKNFVPTGGYGARGAFQEIAPKGSFLNEGV